MSKQQDLLEQKVKSLLGGRLHMKKNYRPEWLRNPKTGNNFEIDIYIPKFLLGIEFQGVHHFKNNITSDYRTDGVRYNDTTKRLLAKKRKNVSIVEIFEEDLTVKPFSKLFFSRVKACCRPKQYNDIHKQFLAVSAPRKRTEKQLIEHDDNGHWII